MSNKKITPMGNRIVVRREEAKTTKGGILLPEAAQQKPREGTVISVGPGKVDDKGRLQKTELKAGDKILFSSYSGTEYKSDEIEYLILAEDDVLAVYN